MSLLLISPNNDTSSLNTLTNLLSTHYNTPLTTNTTNTNTLGTLHFNNTYFSADVNVSRTTYTQGETPYKTLQDDASVTHDAAVLIVKTHPTTEDDKTNNEELVKSACSNMPDEVGVEVRLVVILCDTPTSYNEATMVTEKEEDDTQVVSEDASGSSLPLPTWCAISGFEYLPLKTYAPTEGMDDREKEGFPRLCEALDMCLWSSRIEVDRKGEGGEEVGTDKDKKDVQNTLPTPPPAVDVNALDKDGASTLLSSLLPPGMPGSGDEEDAMADELEYLMASVSQIRDKSINGGFQNDEERKKAAAETAERLMAMMGMGGGMEGLMGGFEDDDEEDEDEGGKPGAE